MAGPRDMRLGNRAVEQGWLTEAELQQALREQEAYRSQGKAVRLGDLLVARNLLTREQLDSLIGDRTSASGAQAIIAERKRKGMVNAVIGVVIVGLLGVLLFLLKDTLTTWQGLGDDGGEDVADTGDEGPVRPTTPGGRPGKGKGRPAKGTGKTAKSKHPRRAKGRAALDKVKAYAESHPEDIDGVHQRLRDIIEKYPVVAGEARQWQKEIEAERERQADTFYRERAGKGQALFDAGKVSEALAIFHDFPTRLQGTSTQAKIAEWPGALRQQARDRLGKAADVASALLETGKMREALEALAPVRAYERLAAESNTGRMLVDLVQGLRSRAEWLARAAAQKVLAELVPPVLEAIKRRDFGTARDTVAKQITDGGNPMLRQEARFLQSDLRGCEWALRLLDARLRALAAGGADLTLQMGSVRRKGALSLNGAGRDAAVQWKSGDTVRTLHASELPAADLVALGQDTRVPPLVNAARYALGVLALASGDWESARALLSGFQGPRAQTWFRRAESAGNEALEGSMGPDLRRAKAKLDAREWKAALAILDRLRDSAGWPVEGESGPRRQMADMWSRARTEQLGISRLLSGQVGVLPGDRVQIAYDWSDEGQLNDFHVRGGEPRTLGTKLHCAVGTATTHQLDFEGDVEVRARATGREFGVLISGRTDKDGYHCWFGKGGEVLILKDGATVARGPFAPDPDRPYIIRVLRRGGHLQLEVDGREILGYDDGSPIAGRGRLGFFGGPGDTMYAMVVITGRFDPKNVAKAVEAAAKARRPPRSKQMLQKGRDLSAWEPVRGTWKIQKGAIVANGNDAYLSHRQAGRWELQNYQISVEARRMRRRSDAPALVFPVDGKDVVWVLSNGGSYLLGLPGAVMAPKADDLSFKFKTVTVVVKKGRVRGFIGKQPVFEARADAADGRVSFGATSGLGLGCKGGDVAFRNPVFKALR